MDKAIGKAQCQAVVSFSKRQRTYAAGVVRIGDNNKIVVVQVSNGEIVRVRAPRRRLDELDRNPAFSCWPLASLGEAKRVIKGVLPTRYQSSLCTTSVEDFMGKG